MSHIVGHIGKEIKVHIEKDVQPAFTSECERRMRKYVPTDGGNHLRDLIHVGRDYIEYISPYARYQYYGKLMVDPKYNIGAFYNPKTNRFWSRRGVKKVLSSRNLVYHTPRNWSLLGPANVDGRGKANNKRYGEISK